MEITKRIREEIDDLPVSKAVADGLRVAEAAGEADFANWCRLELAGYWASNPVLTEETVVPEYRAVMGQHADIYGRVLVLPEDLAFVGETRLRNGIEELEALARTRETVMIHDPHMCELIRRHLQVDVYSFRFSAVHLTGIFSEIREALRQKLNRLEGASITSKCAPLNTQPEPEKILQLKPAFYGISIDLGALWRRWKGKQ